MCTCNRLLGFVIKLDERRGGARPYSVSSGLTFVDWREGGGAADRGGKVKARCPDCYADVQVKWGRIIDILDALDRESQIARIEGVDTMSSGHAVRELRME